MNRPLRWSRRAIATVVVALVATAMPAAAHVVYQGGSNTWLYYSSSNCTAGYSEISHGTGSGYSKAKVYSRYFSDSFQTYCGATFSRPAGYHAINRQLWWAPNESSYPSVCRDVGYVYSSSAGSDFTNIATYGYLICGPGRYATYANMYILNGSWYGGPLSSGGHNTPF